MKLVLIARTSACVGVCAPWDACAQVPAWRRVCRGACAEHGVLRITDVGAQRFVAMCLSSSLRKGVCAEVSTPRCLRGAVQRCLRRGASAWNSTQRKCLHGRACTNVLAQNGFHQSARRCPYKQLPAQKCPRGGACIELFAQRCLHAGACAQICLV